MIASDHDSVKVSTNRAWQCHAHRRNIKQFSDKVW